MFKAIIEAIVNSWKIVLEFEELQKVMKKKLNQTTMIEAKDLRIGNYLQLMTEPNPVIIPSGFVKQVSEIRSTNITMYFIDKPIHEQGLPMQHNLDRLCAIPLTEEWWTKFGYESFKEFINCLHEHSKIPLADENLDFWVEKLEGFYVHEIQNLYSSLTGGLELTMKESEVMKFVNYYNTDGTVNKSIEK